MLHLGDDARAFEWLSSLLDLIMLIYCFYAIAFAISTMVQALVSCCSCPQVCGFFTLTVIIVTDCHFSFVLEPPHHLSQVIACQNGWHKFIPPGLVTGSHHRNNQYSWKIAHSSGNSRRSRTYHPNSRNDRKGPWLSNLSVPNLFPSQCELSYCIIRGVCDSSFLRGDLHRIARTTKSEDSDTKKQGILKTAIIATTSRRQQSLWHAYSHPQRSDWNNPERGDYWVSGNDNRKYYHASSADKKGGSANVFVFFTELVYWNLDVRDRQDPGKLAMLHWKYLICLHQIDLIELLSWQKNSILTD